MSSKTRQNAFSGVRVKSCRAKNALRHWAYKWASLTSQYWNHRHL